MTLVSTKIWAFTLCSLGTQTEACETNGSCGGPLQDVAASFSDALSRQPSSSSSSLRRLWLGVAAQASGTSLSWCVPRHLFQSVPLHGSAVPARLEQVLAGLHAHIHVA